MLLALRAVALAGIDGLTVRSWGRLRSGCTRRRSRRESADLADWFDFAGARFELLDGDAEILPGLSVIATPGHTRGHQSVVIHGGNGDDLLIGDAAYTPLLYAGPDEQKLPPGQAEDRDAWAASLGRIRATEAARVHFCHHTDVIHA